MSKNVEKKAFNEKKITREVLVDLRSKILSLGTIAHYEKARQLGAEYPLFSSRTLIDYSRLLSGLCDEVFQMHLDGKVSLTALSQFCGWDVKTQKYMAVEYVDKKLTPSLLRIIRQLKREHDMGWEEAIGRATGTIPMDRPRRPEERKNLDQILTEIADKGARWRAMVSMAIEMVGEEEAAAGIHQALFEKVAVLRELIGNQYDMVNGRFNRYMSLIKARLRKAMEGPPEEIIDVDAQALREDDGVAPAEPLGESGKDENLVDE
jgi:hypothetical protein